jgi:Flp pilus assembly protein TadD
MSPVSNRIFGRGRSFTFALLATTAVAALCGCTHHTPHLFASNSDGVPSDSMKLASDNQDSVVAQWAAAYARRPDDPDTVLGYAYALKSTGLKPQALNILKVGFAAHPDNGKIASDLGRLALELNRPDIAKTALKAAADQGQDDWRTLSAEGTLLAQDGNHAEAQQYFLAALRQKPDAIPVINNLALSYALGGKPQEAEKLLKQAMADGAKDQRIRQNLALVLGLQGKFSEAKEVASVDISPSDAQANIAYLRNMLAKPIETADSESVPPPPGSDWQPFVGRSKKTSSGASRAVAAASSPKPRARSRDFADAAPVSQEPKPRAQSQDFADAVPVSQEPKPAPSLPVQTATAKSPRAATELAQAEPVVASEVSAAPIKITPSIAQPYEPESRSGTAVKTATRVESDADDGTLRNNSN